VRGQHPGGDVKATVYTETVVHVAPPKFLADAPYQVAIIDLEGGARTTVRIVGGRVVIGDSVERVETRDGVDYYKKVLL
jgi:uncharacterized OB-fold protein